MYNDCYYLYLMMVAGIRQWTSEARSFPCDDWENVQRFPFNFVNMHGENFHTFCKWKWIATQIRNDVFDARIVVRYLSGVWCLLYSLHWNCSFLDNFFFFQLLSFLKANERNFKYQPIHFNRLHETFYSQTNKHKHTFIL